MGRSFLLHAISIGGLAIGLYATFDLRRRWWISFLAWGLTYVIFKRWGPAAEQSDADGSPGSPNESQKPAN